MCFCKVNDLRDELDIVFASRHTRVSGHIKRVVVANRISTKSHTGDRPLRTIKRVPLSIPTDLIGVVTLPRNPRGISVEPGKVVRLKEVMDAATLLHCQPPIPLYVHTITHMAGEPIRLVARQPIMLSGNFRHVT